MPIIVPMALGSIGALVCTILIVIMVLPENKREKLPKFFQLLHDLFNFKYLVLEKILKFCYILATLSTIFTGVLMIFSGERDFYGDFHWFGGYGLLIAILGPIALRIAYETIMMFILLVKNTIEINKKMK